MQIKFTVNIYWLLVVIPSPHQPLKGMTYAFIQYSLWRYRNNSSQGVLALVADSSANQWAIHKFFTNL